VASNHQSLTQSPTRGPPEHLRPVLFTNCYYCIPRAWGCCYVWQSWVA